jgi:uncharacterized protein (DUF302 family)
MADIEYGFVKRMPGVAPDQAEERVTAALKEEGFGVLTHIDVKQTLKEKLDADFREYRILGACNPPAAHKALNAESHIGLLLPCNTVVQSDGTGGSVVSLFNPRAAFSLIDNPELEPVMEEIEQRLKRVHQALD